MQPQPVESDVNGLGYCLSNVVRVFEVEFALFGHDLELNRWNLLCLLCLLPNNQVTHYINYQTPRLITYINHSTAQVTELTELRADGLKVLTSIATQQATHLHTQLI